MPLQTKLEVSRPGDALEQEADRAAEQVLRMPLPPGGNEPAAHPGSGPRLSRYPSGPSAQGPPEAPAAVRHLAHSSGEPLAPATRAFMEPRFGRDFSGVRVHSGAAAAQAARSVNASAYTMGQHIVFNTRRYAPDTYEGRRLLAHELAHVVQQSGAAGAHSAGSAVGLSSTASTPRLQREPLLSAAALELAAQHGPRMALLFEEYGGMVETGGVAAEELVVINAAVAEAEVAVAAATEAAAIGTTAAAVGETGLVATAALAADDVTGIGVGDDIAIPFTLIAGLVGVGVSAGLVYYYRDEIAGALRAAADAVAEVIRLIENVVERGRVPASDPVPVEGDTETETRTEPRADTRERRAPRPDVDVDLDRRRRRPRGCTYMSIAQQFGRYPCHADYARSLSGVSREIEVVTPEGDPADFDAIDAGDSLYEVKTGYRWLAFTPNDASRQATVARFYAQAANQMIVAERCGHPLVWYFNDPIAASFFGAENAPNPEYEQVPMPVPVLYVPFPCPPDSDG